MRFSRSFFHVTIKITIKEIENGFLCTLRISLKGGKDPQKKEVVSQNYWVFHLMQMS